MCFAGSYEVVNLRVKFFSCLKGILTCNRLLDYHVQHNKAMAMVNKNNDNRTNHSSSCMLFPHVRRLLMACEYCLHQNIRGLMYSLMSVK